MALPTEELPLLGEPPPLPFSAASASQVDPQQLHHSLQRLETFLQFLGFFHDSLLSLSLSSLTFLVVDAAAPAFVILYLYCSSCDRYNVKTFELEILICQVAVAGLSLLCISRNLRKYGLRNFVFVDKCSAYAAQFQLDYIREIDDFFRLLAVWVLPCLILKIAREIARVFYVGTDSLGLSLLSVFILLLSWVYSATVYLSGSTLFSLVCNLQVIHFENYMKLLERDLGVLVYIEEHGRLTCHLSNISHRFRMFLILKFLIVTAIVNVWLCWKPRGIIIPSISSMLLILRWTKKERIVSAQIIARQKMI